MPLHNWINFINSNDFIWLSRFKLKCFLNKFALSYITDSIIDFQGASHIYLDVLKTQIQIELLHNKSLINNENNETFIQILDIKLNDLIEKMNTEKNNIEQVLYYIESEMGFKIDTKKITVREFYNYIDFIKTKHS